MSGLCHSWVGSSATLGALMQEVAFWGIRLYRMQGAHKHRARPRC